MVKKAFTFIGNLTRNVDQLSRNLDQLPKDQDQFSANLAHLQPCLLIARTQVPYKDSLAAAKKAFTLATSGKKIACNTPAKPMTPVMLKSCGSFPDAKHTLGMPLPDAHFAGSFPAQTYRLDEKVAALPRLLKAALFERGGMQPAKVSPAVRQSVSAVLTQFPRPARKAKQLVTVLLQAKLHEFYTPKAMEGSNGHEL